jgi:hypothetical protein
MELITLVIIAIVAYFAIRLIVKDLGKSPALSTIAETTAENIAVRAKTSSINLAIEADAIAKTNGMDLDKAVALLGQLTSKEK